MSFLLSVSHYTHTVRPVFNNNHKLSTSSGFYEQRQRADALNKSVNASKETLNMSTKLYKDGLTAFQDVLDAQRSLLAAESSLDQTIGYAAIELVNLYKALAGGWTTDAETNQKSSQ